MKNSIQFPRILRSILFSGLCLFFFSQEIASQNALRISATDYGAIAGDKHDDTQAIQRAINFASEKGTTRYPAAVLIPSGKFRISKPLEWKPRVHIRLADDAVIIATKAMPAMLQSNVGNNKTRLRWQRLSGGIWDANDKAKDGFRLREFAHVTLDNLRILDVKGKYINADGEGSIKTNYELFVHDVEMRRTRPIEDNKSVGIFTGVNRAGLSDCHFDNIIIQGVRDGVVGGYYVCKISKVHVWSFGPKQGVLRHGFYIKGRNNQLYGNQVDNHSGYAFAFTDGKNVLTANAISRSKTKWLPDNIGAAVYIKGPQEIIVTNNIWNVRSEANRLAAEFEGDLRGLRAENNVVRNPEYIVRYFGDYGPGKTEASIDFSPGKPDGKDLVNSEVNVSRVRRKGEGVYSIDFKRPISNERYTVALDYFSELPNQPILPVFREKKTTGLGISFVDLNGKNVVPRRVSIKMLGGN